MKKIELKTIAIAGFENHVLSYRDEIHAVCRIAEEGETIENFPLYFGVINQLKKGTDEIEVTDNEHSILCSRLKTRKWRFVVPEIMEFLQDVIDAPEA